MNFRNASNKGLQSICSYAQNSEPKHWHDLDDYRNDHRHTPRHPYASQMKRIKAMKQTTLLLTLVMSAATLFAADRKPGGGKAREAVVKAYDANKDGELDNKERAAILKVYDANKNGKLDKNEKETLAKSVLEKQEPEKPKDEYPETHAAQSGKDDEIRQQAIELGPGSAHPGTTGEVMLELEDFLLDGDPHACGIIDRKSVV